MKTTENKNPLSSVSLGSYDLTDKGLFTENLQILSALNTAQRRFSKRILSLHPDRGNCFSTRSVERGMCGRWIFFRRFDTGDRAFAGGFYCGSHFCIPCQFRKAYTAAVACHQFVVEQMRRNPSLVPVFHIDELFSQSGLSDQFKELKQSYRKELRRRPHLRPCISGSLCFYHFGVCADCSEWHLSCRELILADSSHASFDHQLSALRVPDHLLFRVIFDLFLCNLINADGMFSRERQFDAMQLTKDMAMFVPYRSFTGFSVPENSSSDVVPAHLAHLPFVEEQYRYDRALSEYVLENINSGDDVQFPFDNYSKGTVKCSSGRRAYKAALHRACRYSRFLDSKEVKS
jgi:hypothetical protein